MSATKSQFVLQLHLIVRRTDRLILVLSLSCPSTHAYNSAVALLESQGTKKSLPLRLN
jgi:hypothetical protein